MTSVIETLQRIEAICPDGPFKRELQGFRESIFLELPEDGPHWWYRASAIFVKHFPANQMDEQPWQVAAASLFTHGQRAWLKEREAIT